MGAAASGETRERRETREPAAQNQPRGFRVRLSPEMAKLYDNEPKTDETIDDVRKRAFNEGVEHAKNEREHEAREDEKYAIEVGVTHTPSDEELSEREHRLQRTVDALQKREYRPPLSTRPCTDEREALAACYRDQCGKPPGDIAFACETAVSQFAQCARTVRAASMAKIVPDSLPPEVSGSG